MNWRVWVYQRLQQLMIGLGHPASSVVAGGSLTGSPSERPFIVYRIQEDTPRLRDDGHAVRTQSRMEVWAYDNPGSYDRIDNILLQARTALSGQVSDVTGAVCCEWDGDGGELFDDNFKALTRVGGYRLIGAS